ncbi:SGNH hydrolase-type esterase domain-containing protein [Nemania sp. FL0031]|nr:SGNH hydrolase-type esterase domain-containing protein [Nemania sp. FL0031]
MPVLLKSRIAVPFVLAILSGALASPFANKTARIAHLLGRDMFEWTALGDSYSSGVGAEKYVDNSYRCLRYDHAYPALINGDTRLTQGDHQFNNVVCSGSSTEDVQNYQFYDEDTSGEPNWQFGDRPKFGNPSMATLSVGGNDIDFPGIIFNCILETHLPFGAGLPQRTCEEQRTVSWELINSPNLVNNIDATIKKVVEKGRKGTIGDKFKLYVTGFPQFFNAETEECNGVTFARTANPNDDGAEHTKMTMELRTEFNEMSVQLNKAIEDAVSRNRDQGVKWVPIDSEMSGHRFCEEGIHEPDQHNNDLWLFHYPYNEPSDGAVDGLLLKAFEKVAAGVNINTAFKRYNDFQNAMFDAISLNATANTRVPLHEKIRDLVLDRYVRDLEVSAPHFEEKNQCHGISGDYWVMSRDIAISNAEAFCGQKDKVVQYNVNSVNELELSIKNLLDDSKGPADAPRCVDRFRDAVIDGCDGDDPVNNPNNYKFGSTFTSADGWEYKMTPLSKQANEVSCSVAYKFFFDSFEVRGKNFVPAKFGKDGEGLKRELSGCGAITSWNFEATPNDARFQWYASGRLPIGTKACVGRALVSAGGSGPDNCHGAGKRSAIDRRRPFGIEDWPGYGDEGRHVFKNEGAGSD